MHKRWGPERRDDFWTALAHGEVDTPELRAMMLLESVCDDYRFTLYSFTAEMPARGNVTGTMFMIEKQGGVIELDDNGSPCAHWCISIGPHSPVPGTDNVVVLKAMLEGEEMEFRRIGNRSSFHGTRWPDAPGIVAPHAQDWIPRDQCKIADQFRDRTGILPDLFELSGLIEALEGEHREQFDNGALRMARTVGSMNRAAEDWIMPDRMPVDFYGMRMGDGLMEDRPLDGGPLRQQRNDGLGLDLYGGEQARADLDDIRRMHERTGDAFMGIQEQGLPMDPTARMRRDIERAVIREIGGVDADGPRGIRLRDGTLLNYDEREAQDVFIRTGVVVADEIHKMNSEGYNAEMIRYAMLEFFGVHQVQEGANIQYGTGAYGGIAQYVTAQGGFFNGAQQEYPGQYMTPQEIMANYPGAVVRPGVFDRYQLV